MSFQELFKTSIRSLVSNKLRTFLTILGIIIGITAVITLLNVGQAAQNTITNTVNSLGSDLITIVPGKINRNSQFGIDLSSKFTLKDVEALNKPSNYYTGVAGYSAFSQTVQYGNKTYKTTLAGIYGDYFRIRSINVTSGRQFTAEEDRSLARVAVVGTEVVKNLFEGESPIGKKIKINGNLLTIIGVNEEKGTTGIASPDEIVFVPLSTAQKVFVGDDSVRTIYLQSKDAKSVDFAQQEAEIRLRQSRGITQDQESDFTIRNSGQILDTLNQITSIFTLFLAAIGAISLLVGGIGIMNIMFVTVRERTREIGLRKALGATNRDILLQFLTEAIVITTFGGIVGTILGIILSLLFAVVANISPVVSPMSVILSVGVSSLIGLVFGIYPANQAARLSPIDALRFE